MLQEKDIHLYHFLLRYPGRTIIFLSSIDGIRRLHPLLVLLGINVVQLHSGMQQRARLKSLDRYVLSPPDLTADPAQIQGLAQHDSPRDRRRCAWSRHSLRVACDALPAPPFSGRVRASIGTYRASGTGRSCRAARCSSGEADAEAPHDQSGQGCAFFSARKRTDEDTDIDLPSLPTDFSILDKLKERIELAKKIESTMHKATKEAHEDNWIQQAAAAMDIEIDSDMECVSLDYPCAPTDDATDSRTERRTEDESRESSSRAKRPKSRNSRRSCRRCWTSRS